MKQCHNDRELGRALWQQLNSVIILTQQMRITDEKYQQLLDQVSDGKGTQKDYQFLQTRIMTPDTIIRGTYFEDALMIVPGNALVRGLNKIHAVFHAPSRGYQLIINPARDKCTEFHFTDSKLKMLKKLALTKTGNLPHECLLFPGMPVILTDNMAVQLGLTNSTPGIVKKIICDPREQTSHSDIHTLQIQPVCVIVTFPTTTCSQLEGLDKQDIPIYPVSHSFSYRFPGALTYASICWTQLPLVPAYSYTAYKSQAQTLPCAIVDLVPSPPLQVKDTSFAYVPLSRIREAKQLHILRPFDIGVLQMEKSLDHQAQDARFARLSIA